MLKRVEQVLRELGLVASQAPLHCYINITSGDSLAISAFTGGANFFQIKASEYLNLAPLYESYCAASRDFGAFVPRPLGYREYDGWSIMVTAGVRHTVARPERVLNRAAEGPSGLTRQLLDFLRRGSQLQSRPDPDWLAELQAYFAPTPWACAAAGCISQALALGVESMRTVPQHGDFVINNLGWSEGALVVFDWEDYRKVGLPGLDIFTLVLSLLAQDDIAALRALADVHGRHEGRVEEFVRRACEVQDIAPALFRGLVPLYLLVFLYLKRNYGVQIQERIARTLLQLAPAAVGAQARAFEGAR